MNNLLYLFSQIKILYYIDRLFYLYWNCHMGGSRHELLNEDIQKIIIKINKIISNNKNLEIDMLNYLIYIKRNEFYINSYEDLASQYWIKVFINIIGICKQFNEPKILEFISDLHPHHLNDLINYAKPLFLPSQSNQIKNKIISATAIDKYCYKKFYKNIDNYLNSLDDLYNIIK